MKRRRERSGVGREGESFVEPMVSYIVQALTTSWLFELENCLDIRIF